MSEVPFNVATKGHTRAVFKPVSKEKAEKEHRAEYRGWAQTCTCGWKDGRLKEAKLSKNGISRASWEPLDVFEGRFKQHLMDVWHAAQQMEFEL